MSIKDIEVVDSNFEPKYLKPICIRYRINNKLIDWEAVENHDSVFILIRNVDRDTFVLVKQFRAAIYASKYFHQNSKTVGHLSNEKLDLKEGEALELCAGLCDKTGKTIEECASEEVFEETGYSVKASDLKRVTSVMSASRVGIGTIFYVEVKNEQKMSSGGGLDSEGESILVEEVPCVSFAKSVINDTESKISTNLALKFACSWFLLTIKS